MARADSVVSTVNDVSEIYVSVVVGKLLCTNRASGWVGRSGGTAVAALARQPAGDGIFIMDGFTKMANTMYSDKCWVLYDVIRLIDDVIKGRRCRI